MTVVKSMDQIQVVIGNRVEEVYNELVILLAYKSRFKTKNN